MILATLWLHRNQVDHLNPSMIFAMVALKNGILILARVYLFAVFTKNKFQRFARYSKGIEIRNLTNYLFNNGYARLT